MRYDRKSILIGIFIIVGILTASSCSSPEKSFISNAKTENYTFKSPLFPFKAVDINPRVKQLNLKLKTLNLIFIIDVSTAMSSLYRGKTRFSFAKEIAARINQTIPNIQLNIALRIFGVNKILNNKLIYGPVKYERSKLKKVLASIALGDGINSPAAAINALNLDLKKKQGKTAIIIISRWEQIDEASIIATKKLRNRYTKRICIYTIGVGNRFPCNRLMQLGECGFSKNADSIASARNMANFVEKILFEEPVLNDAKEPKS